MRTVTLRVNRLVTYWRTATRPVPAKIVSVTDADTCTVKTLSANTTHTLVDRQSLTKPLLANRWSVG